MERFYNDAPLKDLPYFSGYTPHFFPPLINHESGVRLILGHRHLEASSGYRLVRDIIARCAKIAL